MNSPIKLIKTYANFVKLAHTVFALPFALVGMIAAYAVPVPGGRAAFYWTTLGLILLCMVGARSFAMGVNRILDRRIDALNPRTATRELPSGAISLPQAWAFAVLMAGLYFGSCAMLGPVVLALSPVPILLMLVYPLTKRFTWFCHVVLGASLGLAPVGAWVTVRAGRFGAPVQGWDAVSEPLPWLLGGAVMLWVAGFDVIYALQDDEFDRENKLHSIPARFGRRGGLWISRGMHVISAALFLAFTVVIVRFAPWASMPAWIAAGAMLAGLVFQQSLVRANDLRHVNMAFFTVNGVISVVFGVVWAAAWLMG